MPTITAQNIIEDVLITLHEDLDSPVRWDKDKLLRALNNGQRQIVKFKPEAYAVTGPIQTVAGTKQTIPATGIQLIDITRNMGLDGSTPGKVIRRCTRAELDEERPDWHIETASQVAKNFVFDPKSPKVFYLWPQQPSSEPHQVEGVYSASPADVTVSDWGSGTDVITLDDIYSTDLYHWILHVAYSKDATHAANAGRSASYFQAFMHGLGMMDQAEASIQMPPTPRPQKP